MQGAWERLFALWLSCRGDRIVEFVFMFLKLSESRETIFFSCKTWIEKLRSIQ
jgi:hypothetical protein